MKKYPTKFQHIREPYGTLHLTGCVITEHEGSGRYTVEGTVEKGGTCSFLCGYSHFRDETGKRHVIHGVKKWELEQGYCRDIAM